MPRWSTCPSTPLAQPGPYEAYLSVIQSKLLTLDDFEDLDELATQILAFEKNYNAAARPSTRSSPAPTSTDSWHASGSTTGTHGTRWPHETRRINGRDH